MVKAIVLVNTDTDMGPELSEEIRKYPGVVDARLIYGPYDMYVKVDAETEDEVRALVLDKIRNHHGIKSTTTCFNLD